MEKFQPLLLDIWREACRHIEIEASTATIAGILARQLPLERVVVRRHDPVTEAIETAAASGPRRRDLASAPRTALTAADHRRFHQWFRSGRRLHGRVGDPRHPELAFLAPFAGDADVLAGALGPDREAGGALLLVARAGTTFSATHERIFASLLEPFSVALENDLRLRELRALRDAAEADKRALLVRLGREDMVDRIVGDGSGLRQVMERVELVSRSDVPVLIFGETGTGKELIARAIHARSVRGAGPFLRVNCGAIPSELIDSELFGHERGSFTGAVSQRRGWFERADGGTLLLDEVAELPPPAQVRLLGVLQDGCFDRVGGEEQIRVSVRIIGATHRDLPAMVAEGTFREDLWYRLAVFPIVLPPLRERKGDIPALARHFAERAATRFGLAPRVPTDEDVAPLLPYAWPGNIRELAAVIERAAILGDGRGLEIATALGAGAPADSAASGEPPAAGGTAGTAGTLPTLDAAMRRHIEAALVATRGRVEGRGGAASLLGINPHTLRARMRKLGVDWGRYREGRTGAS